MSERSELRRRREERMENGVKNLKGARLFPKTFVLNLATRYHGNKEAYFLFSCLTITFASDKNDRWNRLIKFKHKNN